MSFFKKLTLEFVIGLFFILAVLILFYFTVLIDGTDLLIGNKFHHYNVQFTEVGELNENDKVFIRGMKIGKVKSVEMDNSFEKINVVLALDKKVPFYKDYKIKIKPASLFGGQVISIHLGTPTLNFVEKDKVLIGMPYFDLMQEASDFVGELKNGDLFDNIQEFVRELKQGGLIENIQSAAKELKQGAENFQELTETIKSGDGTVSKLINDDSLYKDAKAMVKDISDASKELNKFISDAEKEFNTFADKLNNGKGTLGKLVNDDTLYKDAKQMVATIESAAKKIEDFGTQFKEGKGTLPKLMNDPELYNETQKMITNLNEASENIRIIATDLKEGNGTLGKIMTDDELYTDLKATIKELKAAVEDFREQAPISTFGNMVFGAL